MNSIEQIQSRLESLADSQKREIQQQKVSQRQARQKEAQEYLSNTIWKLEKFTVNGEPWREDGKLDTNGMLVDPNKPGPTSAELIFYQDHMYVIYNTSYITNAQYWKSTLEKQFCLALARHGDNLKGDISDQLELAKRRSLRAKNSLKKVGFLSHQTFGKLSDDYQLQQEVDTIYTFLLNQLSASYSQFLEKNINTFINQDISDVEKTIQKFISDFFSSHVLNHNNKELTVPEFFIEAITEEVINLYCKEIYDDILCYSGACNITIEPFSNFTSIPIERFKQEDKESFGIIDDEIIVSNQHADFASGPHRVGTNQRRAVKIDKERNLLILTAVVAAHDNAIVKGLWSRVEKIPMQVIPTDVSYMYGAWSLKMDMDANNNPEINIKGLLILTPKKFALAINDVELNELKPPKGIEPNYPRILNSIFFIEGDASYRSFAGNGKVFCTVTRSSNLIYMPQSDQSKVQASINIHGNATGTGQFSFSLTSEVSSESYSFLLERANIVDSCNNSNTQTPNSTSPTTSFDILPGMETVKSTGATSRINFGGVITPLSSLQQKTPIRRSYTEGEGLLGTNETKAGEDDAYSSRRIQRGKSFSGAE